MDLTVITPSMPRRAKLLEICKASVAAQTVPVYAHQVRVEDPPNGVLSLDHVMYQRHKLLERVTTEWVAVLDDDDVYLSHHTETIAPWLNDEADVVYTWSATHGLCPRVDLTGFEWWRAMRALQESVCVPQTAAMRTDFLRSLGGWGPTIHGCEWWGLWRRFAQVGARFRCIPVETWEYRRDDAWEHVYK